MEDFDKGQNRVIALLNTWETAKIGRTSAIPWRQP